MAIFVLLFQLANFLHEQQKINHEIELIRDQNRAVEVELLSKEQQLEYLNTPQRVDKVAKMQMGKKQAGEEVLIFVGEPSLTDRTLGAVISVLPQVENRTPLQQWRWVFLDRFEDN